MPTTELYTGTLVAVSCGDCGMIFGMPEDFRKARMKDHRVWYCPNGHGRVYNGESETERLKRELAREKHWHEQAQADANLVRAQRDAVERRLRGTKSVVTRMKRRIAAGRCTCCSRQFKDLERHMKNEHPNWSPDKAAEAMAAKS